MRVLPEPSHEPVGFSHEVFPESHRWRFFTILVILTIVLGAAAAARLS